MKISYPLMVTLSILSLPLLQGCGASGEYGHVTGVVTINGQPVEDALVTFAPAEGGRSALASTEADGSYELNYTPGVKGAMIGVNKVMLSTYAEPSRDDNNRISDPGKPERFPPQYTSGDHTVEVKPGENTFDFDVEAEKDAYPMRR